MADLTPADVEDFTGGRLASSDTTTQLVLDAELARARRYCGWPVTPPRSETLTLDGPCSDRLCLPTRKLNSITSVTEDGVQLDIATLSWSADGFVWKSAGASWSCEYRSITVVMDHGYTEAEAADWRHAVLSMVDRISTPGGGSFTGIGPFQYGSSAEVQFSDVERSIFDSYRLGLWP